MLSDIFIEKSKQSVFSGLSASGKVNSVLNFLESNLFEFTLKFEIIEDTDEWKLNEELFSFLEINSRKYCFQFIPEYRYKNKSKPDFGIKEVKTDENGYLVYDSKSEHLFDIECKRLYNPNIKQYVNGNTGGIQRFKANKHGVDLPQSAMIGYVETNDFNFWHKKVNSWIMDSNEHLKMLKNNNIAKLESEHQRSGSKISKIKLTHFWLKIIFKKL